MAAAQVFLPAGQRGIDGAEGDEQAATLAAAVLREARVHGGNVLVQERVEAAGPGLGDATPHKHFSYRHWK